MNTLRPPTPVVIEGDPAATLPHYLVAWVEGLCIGQLGRPPMSEARTGNEKNVRHDSSSSQQSHIFCQFSASSARSPFFHTIGGHSARESLGVPVGPTHSQAGLQRDGFGMQGQGHRGCCPLAQKAQSRNGQECHPGCSCHPLLIKKAGAWPPHQARTKRRRGFSSPSGGGKRRREGEQGTQQALNT